MHKRSVDAVLVMSLPVCSWRSVALIASATFVCTVEDPVSGIGAEGEEDRDFIAEIAPEDGLEVMIAVAWYCLCLVQQRFAVFI